eukprot:6920244-Karenia_brevis.AAC.1
MGIGAAAQMSDLRALRCRGDSLLLIMQALGHWRVRQPMLLEMRSRVIEAVARIEGVVEWEHVDRSCNWRADALANRAVDSGLAGRHERWE